MENAFDENEKAMLAQKQFNRQVLRKMRNLTIMEFEYHSMFNFFFDFITLIPGADTPCATHNFELMKKFARDQSSVYKTLPCLTKDVNGQLTESGHVLYEKNWIGV
ncbi:hypothetical protein NW768_010132 [Fusarium equiseti]|uniref:Uncharacterized protein n=1 Tax=Fusarium equiseti TaxID=61235 RepID=A0ABQ8R0X7_FUSEQ|nr:hypothetical protein NW768_010132 [Fusarium equiseti]